MLVLEHGITYPTTAAMLLFGKKPQMHFTEATLAVCHFSGTSGREALAHINCEGTLLQQFRDAFHFITTRIPRAFTIKGAIRQETLEVPPEAIREALLNMLVHRNYHIQAQGKIFIYDDRIEFFSPGDIPGPFNVHKLRSGLTYIRNPTICNFFRRAGLIEKLGTGLITMLDTMEKQGLEPPKLIEGENFVKCILPRIPQKLQASREDKIITYLRQVQRASISDIMRALSLSRTTCYRRLEKLVQEGTLERIGTRKDVTYILKEPLT
ncbi:MAG: winged helix-turn-helix transcriptional regulator [Verrucomicrobiota bacterium]|nr:winged helix-turn-helix transcriptional regulator [Verrucomicrobiota bacterium]